MNSFSSVDLKRKPFIERKWKWVNLLVNLHYRKPYFKQRDLHLRAKYCQGVNFLPLSTERSSTHRSGRGELANLIRMYATWKSWKSEHKEVSKQKALTAHCSERILAKASSFLSCTDSTEERLGFGLYQYSYFRSWKGYKKSQYKFVIVLLTS